MTRPWRLCGIASEDTRELTADEREAWPSIAGWVRVVCPPCRAMFRRSAEKFKTKAAA